MRSHSLPPALVALFAVCVATTAAAQKPYSCPSCNLANTNFTTKGYDLVGANLSNAILTGANFTGLDLTNATLSGADLTSAKFTNAKLTNADLSAATLTKTDFTGVTLAKANFQFAKFDCTVIAESDVFEAEFGPTLNLTSCRTSFASTTMNCEFIGQWKDLDLTQANISKCFGQLSGADFTNAVMPGVVFSSGDPKKPTNLSNTKWSGANLARANFTSAILMNADFSGSSESTAANLRNANLSYVWAENANFTYARLGYDPDNLPPQPGARLAFAYLVKARFTHANLELTDFSLADVTGGDFADAKLSGARFAGANLSGARFVGSNLSGLDLSQDEYKTRGVDMSNANLSNVNLKDMHFGPALYETCGETTAGYCAPWQDKTKAMVTVVASSFVGAILCGATVDHTNFDCADLTGASMPATDIKSDGKITCGAFKSTPITNGVKSDGGCFTICPNGTPGPCSGTQWSPGAVPPPPCCVATKTTSCPPTKRSDVPCTSDCECTSRNCAGGLCK